MVAQQNNVLHPKPSHRVVRASQPNGLLPDAIERCVRTVDLVLRSRGNREEVIAAIDRLFGMEQPPPPSLESSVHDIGLGLRTASMLDDAGIMTAFDLRKALLMRRVHGLRQFGQMAVQECEGAIKLIEGRVHDYQI